MDSSTGTTGSARGRPIRLMDLLALTCGYGLASLLFRLFWPANSGLSPIDAILLTVVFAWLGLATSGPFVLLLDRRRPSTRPGRLVRDRPPPGRTHAGVSIAPIPSRYTRAELAWMSIGGYWVGMALFLIPIRSSEAPLGFLLVLETIAALGLFAVAPRARPHGEVGWTHRAALGMLISWPLVWGVSIYLVQSR